MHISHQVRLLYSESFIITHNKVVLANDMSMTVMATKPDRMNLKILSRS